MHLGPLSEPEVHAGVRAPGPWLDGKTNVNRASPRPAKTHNPLLHTA
jgi:hypothetical protein